VTASSHGREPPEAGEPAAPIDLRSYLYDVLSASSHVGFALFDRHGLLVDCNDTVLAWLGLRRDDIVGRNFTDLGWRLVHEDGSPFTIDETAAVSAMRSGEPSRGVVMGIDLGDRPRRWLAVTSYPVVARGELHGVVSSYTDVTDRVTREQMLRLLATVQGSLITAARSDDALQRVCVDLVDEGHVDVARLHRASTDDGAAVLVASAGERHALGADATASDEAVTDELAREALRTHRVRVANHLEPHEALDFGRGPVPSGDARSAIAFPFQNEPLVLTLYARRAATFEDAFVEGLSQIVREVEHALARLRADERTTSALEAATQALEAQRSAEAAQRVAEQRFELAFEENMSPMIIADGEDRIIAANRAFCDMVGRSLDELLDHDSTLFTHPDDVGITEAAHQRLLERGEGQVRYVKRYLHADGHPLWAEVSRSAARDASGRLLYYVISERDVTEERALGAQLAHRALHDPLTGTANRALFDDRLAQAHARTLRRHEWGAVLLLDLDDFKGVNDTYGHLIGDQILMAVARRLESVARSSDTLSRFGGDEFLYLAEPLSSPEEAQAIAARLLSSLTRPFTVGDLEIVQGASVGISVWDQARSDPRSLVQEADTALYQAKAHQRGRSVLFTPAMHEHETARFTLLQDLRTALRDDEFEMHYQPIVSLDTLEIVGLEALMRWFHPPRGWIPPSSFINAAEDSDMVIELGRLALAQAIRTAVAVGALPRPPFVTVNFSARQFHDPNLVDSVATALNEAHLDPRRLVIEITESVTLVDAEESRLAVERLAALGVRIALDDFGTGYSSLSYLTDLQPSIIKIDQSFVQATSRRALSETLLGAIVSIGHRFHTTMLAEGIETERHLEIVRRLGCDLAQGFLFSPAVVPESLASLLEEAPTRWAETFGLG
jgi:diguanylate cyclase (GGDEF)-like protein/PAS domain S-box-containing protein